MILVIHHHVAIMHNAVMVNANVSPITREMLTRDVDPNVF